MREQLRMTPAECRPSNRAHAHSAAEPEKLGKRQVVLRLLPTIRLMVRGYSLAAIAGKSRRSASAT